MTESTLPPPEGSALDCRVLIVEDAVSTRQLLRGVLKGTTFEVVGEADSGRHALEEAQRLHPDVILLDLSLSDMDGAELVPEFLRLVPDAKIVVLSNNARLAGPELIHRGAAAYIEKGLPPDKLLAALAAAISDRPRSSAYVSDPSWARRSSIPMATGLPTALQAPD